MDVRRPSYVRPSVTGKQGFETHAIGCAKMPAIGNPDVCGQTNYKGVCPSTPSLVARSS